jgi:hypothetical protein
MTDQGAHDAVLAAVDAQHLGFTGTGHRRSFHIWVTDRKKRDLTPAELECVTDLLNSGEFRLEQSPGRYGRAVVTRRRWTVDSRYYPAAR